jgi:hypothetical protein
MKDKLLLMSCILAAGCASPPVHYVSLEAQNNAVAMRDDPTSIEIGPLVLPASLERPQLVLSGGAGRLTVLEQTRWSGPLSRLVAQTLADDVSRDLGMTQVVAFPQPSGWPSQFKVLIEVHDLLGVPGEHVHLDAGWRVLQDGQPRAQGRFVVDEPCREPGVDGVVAAHSRVLAAFAVQLAAALQPLLTMR